MSTEIKTKKKVLFVITQSEMGGAQRFFMELLPRLDREKYEVLMAIGSTMAPSEEFTRNLKEHHFKIITIKHLKRDSSFLFLHDWLAVWELRKLLKNFRPHTLFLNSSKAGFIGSLAATWPFKIKGLKIIYRIGGWTFNDPWSWWQKKLWIFLEKISAKWKDLIIVNNKHDLEQAYLLKIGGKEKVKLIYNGLDPYRLKFLEKEEAKIKILEKIHKTTDRILQNTTIIGTITNFYPSKGVEYLIQTAAFLKEEKNLIFWIIGDGSERERLENLIANYDLKDKVFLLGHLENALQYLPAFDIFVLPSVKEGFPWALLEAMAAKLPVITTRVGATPEIIDNSKNGLLVEAAHPEQIAKKIMELQKNDYLKKELGIQGHQTVLLKFSLEKMVREIENLL